MTTASPFAALSERLLSPIVDGPTKVAGRYAFRGEFALKLAASTAGEKRPPEVKADQMILAASGGKLEFFACHVDSVAYLDLVMECFGDLLAAGGNYFLFAGNIDISKKYQVEMNGMTFHILPLDEATVYNELLDLFYLERGDLKKMSGEQKIDAIVDAAKGFRGGFPATPFAQVVAEMGPIKVAENRPV